VRPSQRADTSANDEAGRPVVATAIVTVTITPDAVVAAETAWLDVIATIVIHAILGALAPRGRVRRRIGLNRRSHGKCHGAGGKDDGKSFHDIVSRFGCDIMNTFPV